MSIETTTSVEVTPDTIEVTVENAGDLVTSTSHEVCVQTPEDIVEVVKKEYAIVGDALFASVTTDAAPTWLTGLIDNLVDASIATGLSDYNQLRTDVQAAIDSIDVAQNTYVEQINFDIAVDSVVGSKIETLNATLGTTYATIVDLGIVVSDTNGALVLKAQELSADYNGLISAETLRIDSAIAAETFARTNSIDALTAVYTNQNLAIGGTATAISGLQTYVGVDPDNTPNGTGLAATLTSHSLAFTNLENEVTGTEGEVAYALSNLKQENIVRVNDLGVDIRNTFAYDSTIIINGEYYKTGFGIDSTATGGVSEETAFSSEFWVNAEKLVLKSPTYPGIEANFQVTPTGIVLALEHTEATRNDPKGAYNAGTEYNLGDLVTYSGSSYVALGTHTGITPVEGANWQLLSAAGATGPQGIAGADGSDGSAGADSKAVKLTSAAQVVEYDSADARVTPASILFTATPQNVSVPTYRFFVDDSPIGAASDTATYNYFTSATYVSTPVKIEVEIYDDAVLVGRDQTSVYAIKPGSNVVTVILSNEAHTIPTDSAGNNGVYTDSGTTIKAYEGATELTYEAGTGFPTTNSKFRIVPAPSYITNGAISGDGTTTATVDIASNMTQDVAAITYTINTRNSVAQNVAINKIQTFSKSIAGSTGATGATGTTGVRGTATLTYSLDLGVATPGGIASGTIAGYWNTAASATYQVEIEGDVLILTNTSATSGWTHIYEYDGASWVAYNTFTVNGNQVVNGTLAAEAIGTGSLVSTVSDGYGPLFSLNIDGDGIARFRGIEIRDNADNLIMASGAAMDYSVLGGTKPSPTADQTSTVTSGNGSNVCNARYSTFPESTLPPVGVTNGTVSLETGVAYFGSNSLRISATAPDCYAYLGANGSDYNIPVEGGKSYIVSAYVRSGSSSVATEFWFSEDIGGHVYGASVVGGLANTWTRLSCVITASATAKMVVLRIDNEGGSGVDMLIDGVMIEPQVGTLTTPSPYVPPNSYNNLASSFVNQGAFSFLDQITSANIGTYIDTAAIKTAYIDDLQITTGKVGANAITAVVTSYTGAATAVSLLQERIITTSIDGASVEITAEAYVGTVASGGGGNFINFNLYRDATLLKTVSMRAAADESVYDTCTFTFEDTPPTAGTYTYQLTRTGQACNVSNRYLAAREFKK